MMPLQEKEPRRLKGFLYAGGLVATLIWGTSFLLLAIARFEASRKNDHAIDDFFRLNAPPLVSDKVYPSQKVAGSKPPLNFSLVRNGDFSPYSKSIQWIKTPESSLNDKGTYVLTESHEDSTSYTIKSIVDDSYEYVLYNGTSFDYEGITYHIDELVASPDLSKAVLRSNTTKNWRHSTFALYWTLDVGEQTIVPVYNAVDKLAVTSWSPVSSHLAFILDNNVYVKDIANNSVVQVTSDGSANIFNGKPDWVYEEEVYGSDLALWWSPDGTKVTFLRSDDTNVPDFTIPYYAQDGHKDYPELVTIKYPKAGYSNPVVDLVVYELESEPEVTSKQVQMNSIKDKLITEVVWVSNEYILVKTSNRASTVVEIYLVEATTKNASLIRTHTATDSWFEITSNTLYVPKNVSVGIDDDGYIDTVVVDGYNHLAYFSPPSNPDGILLTKGRWEVLDGVAAFDHLSNDIYFTSTLKSSVERHFHSVNLVDAIKSGKLPEIKNITDTADESWFTGSFSSGLRYLLLNYRGPGVPTQRLVDLHDLSVLEVVEDNEEVAQNLQKYDVPSVRHSVVSLGQLESGEDILANAMETLPLNFNPELKYPVLFFVYGGPGSQLVTKTFSVGFSAVVAAELNAVVVTVDGRGTGYNNYHEKMGANFKFTVRDKLGHYEPLDQIAAAKVWSAKSYVDSDRIAIWGWSYGGFLTLKTLETDTDDRVFKYGVSVAPVTKWKLYDSIYTERYLSEPQVNPKGYETASINSAENFANVTRFLVMHGSGDDNVHFQNSLELVDEFNLASIENFDFMVFPDSDHSITYHNGNHVVYDRILTWLRRAFSDEYV